MQEAAVHLNCSAPLFANAGLCEKSEIFQLVAVEPKATTLRGVTKSGFALASRACYHGYNVRQGNPRGIREGRVRNLLQSQQHFFVRHCLWHHAGDSYGDIRTIPSYRFHFLDAFNGRCLSAHRTAWHNPSTSRVASICSPCTLLADDPQQGRSAKRGQGVQVLAPLSSSFGEKKPES